MAFADSDDVEQALRRELTATEETYVETMLDEASDLVLGYLRQDPTTGSTVPGAVVRVTARMVARVIQQDGVTPGTQQQTAGPFSTTFVSGSSSGSPWLSMSDKITLKPYRRGGGLISVQFRSERGYDESSSS